MVKSDIRIISVVPSITELLFDIGIGAQVVARTKFCVHPKELVRKLPVIGGTKNLHIDKIIALNPDLIIANKEENTREDIEALSRHFEIWLTDIKTIEDNYQLIRDIAARFDKIENGKQIIEKSKDTIARFSNKERKSALYLIWREPYMSVGCDTYIHHMMEAVGYKNCCADKTRYPIVELKQFSESPPDCILLSSEPYPFKQKHITEISKIFPNTEVKLVDGEFFSWYGSRLANMIHN